MTGRQPTVEQVASQALATGRLTRALLLMAAQHNAQSRKWLNAQGKEWPGPDPNTVEDQIDSALSLVALTIVDDAMRAALGENDSLNVKASMPGAPLPAYMHLLVAYALAVVAAIALQLRAEGSRPKLDTQKPCIGVVDALFLLRSKEEKAKIFLMGAKAFTTITRSDAPNVLEWFKNLNDLVILYLLDDEKLKARGFPSMFGFMLKSLLSAAN